jgi:peptidylprolyl isomerase
VAASPTGAATAPAQGEPPTLDLEGDEAILALIEWQTSSDAVPRLVFDPPLGVSQPTARLVEDGAGAPVGEGDLVTFEYVMFSGDNAEAGFSTYDSGRPETIQVAREGMSNAFAESLIGRHVGARIIFATPDSSGTMISEYLLTQFMAVTVTAAQTVPLRAAGASVAPVKGLPKVVLGANGEPNVEMPASKAPSTLIVQPLIMGDGPRLAEGQSVLVNYSLWSWDGAELLDSTWPSGVAATWRMTTGKTITGLVQGLVGQRVKSQVLVVVPPGLGFGDTDTLGIPGGSTLVYVVDVLYAW